MHTRFNINLNNLIYLSRTKIDDDFRAVDHSHPNIELLYVFSNDGYVITTNEKLKIKKGDLVIINAKTTHREISDNGLSFYSIGLNFENAFLTNKETKNIFVVETDNKTRKQIEYIYNSIFDEICDKKEGYENIIDNYYNALLVILKRLELSKNNIDNENDLITNIKRLIDENYSNQISLDNIASNLSISKSSLCHNFYKQTKMTIMQYKINKQLEEAISLLKISDMSIKQISLFVGFNNQNYFNIQFKKHYGLTPLEYKKGQTKTL